MHWKQELPNSKDIESPSDPPARGLFQTCLTFCPGCGGSTFPLSSSARPKDSGPWWWFASFLLRASGWTHCRMSSLEAPFQARALILGEVSPHSLTCAHLGLGKQQGRLGSLREGLCSLLSMGLPTPVLRWGGQVPFTPTPTARLPPQAPTGSSPGLLPAPHSAVSGLALARPGASIPGLAPRCADGILFSSIPKKIKGSMQR